MSSANPSVSVIMRSKNSDWVIGQALTALFSQDFQDFELVLVDSGSTDRTLEIVGQFPCRLFKIPAQEYFPGVVLNRAMQEARGDLVVFQNSDTVPLSSLSLGRLLAPFSNVGVQATFARQVPRPDAEPWVRRDYAISFPASGTNPEWMPLSLPFAGMRRSIWEQHRFQTDSWGSEDTEWGFWARKNGHEVRYVPEATVMHSHNYTLRQLFGRRFIEGEADAFIHRDTLSWFGFLKRVVRSSGADFVNEVRSRTWAGMGRIPVRRWVYHWGYLKGHRLGERRLKTRDGNAGEGQRVVLERYEP